MIRSSSATWKGTGRAGEGHLTSESSSIMSQPFNFDSRFSSNSTRINPEELLAAAHAIDFVMKLSFILAEAGFTALFLNATANISFINGWITSSHIVLTAKIPEITREIFDASVKEAELTCPVSQALKINVSSESMLENSPGSNHI